jgi:hypothetical protein
MGVTPGTVPGVVRTVTAGGIFRVISGTIRWPMPTVTRTAVSDATPERMVKVAVGTTSNAARMVVRTVTCELTLTAIRRGTL